MPNPKANATVKAPRVTARALRGFRSAKFARGRNHAGYSGWTFTTTFSGGGAGAGGTTGTGPESLIGFRGGSTATDFLRGRIKD